MQLHAGDIVLTGGMTDAVAVAPGDDVTVQFTGIGTLHLPVAGTT